MSSQICRMEYPIPTYQFFLMAIMLLSCAQSAVLVWDPSVYNATLEEWYNKPDWPFFEQFFSKRLMKPEDPLYLLHPGNLPTFKLTRRIREAFIKKNHFLIDIRQ